MVCSNSTCHELILFPKLRKRDYQLFELPCKVVLHAYACLLLIGAGCLLRSVPEKTQSYWNPQRWSSHLVPRWSFCHLGTRNRSECNLESYCTGLVIYRRLHKNLVSLAMRRRRRWRRLWWWWCFLLKPSAASPWISTIAAADQVQLLWRLFLLCFLLAQSRGWELEASRGVTSAGCRRQSLPRGLVAGATWRTDWGRSWWRRWGPGTQSPRCRRQSLPPLALLHDYF